jgi:hypothetical protein
MEKRRRLIFYSILRRALSARLRAGGPDPARRV